MKKVILSIISIFIIATVIWWNMPMKFLNGVNTENISYIKVFNGNTGQAYEIENADDISYIVNNIKKFKGKKWKLSAGYVGTRFNLSFVDNKNNIIDKFIINSEAVIRKNPFFYVDANSILCVEYLQNLEENLTLSNE